MTVRRPLATLLVPTVGLTLIAQAIFLLNNWNVMPAKVLELVLLLGGATLLTALTGGRTGVRRPGAVLRQRRRSTAQATEVTARAV